MRLQQSHLHDDSRRERDQVGGSNDVRKRGGIGHQMWPYLGT